MGRQVMTAGAAGTGNIEAIYPATPVQTGMLYHTVLAEQPGMYIMQYSCRLDGPLDVDSFRRAWDSTVSRHQALRSMLIWEGREVPLVLVREEVRLPWTIRDLRSETPERQREVIGDYRSRDRAKHFELDSAPLTRLALFRTGDDSAVFFWTHHHVILDGWSLNIVFEEVLADYALIRSGGTPSRRPAPPFQLFANYLRDQDEEAARRHWTEYLDGFDKPNRLFEARIGASPWSTSQRQISGSLGEEETGRVLEFARRSEMTLDTILRAAWAVVVARHSGDHDVVFGSVVSGRPPELSDALKIVGPFLNTIPVRARVDPGRRISDLLDQLREDGLRARPHEWAPLSDIQEWSDLPGGTPLFSSLLVTENLPGPGLEGDLTVGDFEYHQPNNYPLSLLAFPGARLELVLLHDPDRFDEACAEAMLAHFLQVVSSFDRRGDDTVGDLEIMPDSELRRIVGGGQGASFTPTHDNVVAAILAAAKNEPDAPAVVSAGVSTTYRQLIDRSAHLARHLAGLGVVPGDPVGIVMERSAGVVVAILGVLLGGGAYVPLDPRSPSSRVRDLLADSGCPVLITDEAGRAPTSELTAVALDEHGRGRDWLVDDQVELPDLQPDRLAYVIYTSGSTGEPKGVAVEHRALAHSTAARSVAYGESPAAFLLTSPTFFDSSVAGIFWTLTTGGALILPEIDGEQDMARLADLISEHEVSHLLMLPVMYRLLLETSPPGALSSLRLAIVAGEACGPDLAALHHSRLPNVRMVNEYGPTEATVWSTFHDVQPEDGERARVPIGGPIPGASVFILDSDLRLAPIGAEGELAIAGEGLARGYLGQALPTERSFPIVEIPQVGPTRLYRTGDLARWLEPGVVDLVGRRDRQVKIRGRRLEPEEVESVLERHPLVSSAAVEVVRGGNGDVGLAGFYVPVAGTELGHDEMREYLSSRLPSYLIPSPLIALDSLPVTPNGKIDRSLLRVPDRIDMPLDSVRPLSESEALVVGIAQDLLGHQAVGPEDNFFDAGGHSLLSMHLIARVFSETGVRIGPNTLLFNSLARAAASIDEQRGAGAMMGFASKPGTDRRDEPIRFGEDGGLFGILHSPAGAVPGGDHVVVICPPYGWEYYKSHRALRALARLIWDRMPVLRFDYRGTGDSAGEPGACDLSAWVDDVRTAADEARLRTGLEKVALVGLRLGGSLAVLAADKPGTCERMILWDPVVDGAGHLATLDEMHEALFRRRSRRTARRYSGDSLLGSPYPVRLRADLAELDLIQSPSLADVDTEILVSRDLPEYRALTGGETGRPRLEHVADAGGWDDLTTFNTLLLPGPLPRRIAQLLGGSR